MRAACARARARTSERAPISSSATSVPLCTRHHASMRKQASRSSSDETAGSGATLTTSGGATDDLPNAPSLSADGARRISGPLFAAAVKGPRMPPPSSKRAHASCATAQTFTQPAASAVATIVFAPSSVASSTSGSCGSCPAGKRAVQQPANTSHTEMHPSVPTDRSGSRARAVRKTMLCTDGICRSSLPLRPPSDARALARPLSTPPPLPTPPPSPPPSPPLPLSLIHI